MLKNKKVLVLHQSDELKVISLQDKIAEYFSGNSDFRILKIYPLWGCFSEEISEDFLSKVLELGVKKISFREKSVFLQFSMKDSENNEITSDMEIVRFSKKSPEVSFELPELRCRVFRIVRAHFNESDRSYYLTDSRWVKL